MKQISYGAEAKIFKTKIFGQDVIIKQRIYKEYRNKILNQKIIKQRNKEEANILKKIKQIGLNAPYIYYVSEDKIIMEYIKNNNTHIKQAKKIGQEISKMHDNNIMHGDLNLINIITYKKNIYFIDFGLATTTNKIEDKATDLLVFKKTLLSNKKTEKIWIEIKKGYIENTKNKKILEKIKEIEKRGRYL
ncbi:MAG: KEOPS complex kinase/ATPase Bud32 [Candidatus ainarchaeum sp.]|nr:KEOPS complex kinase/ATPase Bud32 [Candidatus ainarchaeum sp.]MDD3976339.1 KEOPS complex kinase/ATPase Bud32 [Candidatus ainarchaeum sp.]